jgi:hypothetical protein
MLRAESVARTDSPLQPRNFAYVEFEQAAHGEAAVAEADGAELLGAKLVVAWCVAHGPVCLLGMTSLCFVQGEGFSQDS